MIEQSNKGLSGSTLKIIAIVAMLIDHIGAIIFEGKLYSLSYSHETMKVILGIGIAMRFIGRIAFPIFCYLLVEGFLHTRNVKKYAGRLLLFALISEIPFDLAFYGNIFSWRHQNVFITLFIGILVMYGISFFRSKFADKNSMASLLSFAVIVAGMLLAEFLKTDYGALGIIIIVILYLFHERKKAGFISASIIFILYCVGPATSMYEMLKSYNYINTNMYTTVWYMLSSVVQAFAGLAFIPISFYNGKKGISLKYVFYAFYPVHLLILSAIAKFMM